MQEVLLVDPPGEVNLNLPNLALAWAAARLECDVVDLHARPLPVGRLLGREAERVVFSVRPHTLEVCEDLRRRILARHGRTRVLSLAGPVDVQCCYPFLSPWERLRVEMPFNDSLPHPAWERFDSFNYLRANWRSGFWGYPVMTSLGCPFGCVYCAARHRPWRPRSAAHVVEELEWARARFGVRTFEIIDDVFNLDEARAIAFCERVAGLELSWSCVNGLRADRFSDAQARAMARAGCVQVGFGVESVDPEVLARSGKGETLDQIEWAVRTAHKHLREVCVFLIVGLPGSSEASDHAALRWVERMGVKAYFSYFVPESAGAAREAEEAFSSSTTTTSSSSSSSFAFFGSMAHPSDEAYPAERQRAVYEVARRLNREGYWRSGLPLAVARATLRAARLYDGWSWVNHLRHLGRRALPTLLRGEIQ